MKALNDRGQFVIDQTILGSEDPYTTGQSSVTFVKYEMNKLYKYIIQQVKELHSFKWWFLKKREGMRFLAMKNVDSGHWRFEIKVGRQKRLKMAKK